MKVLTNLELEVVVRELNEKILDSKVSKIFLPETRILRLDLHKSNIGKYSLIIDSGKGIYLSEFKLENPQLPPSFAMFLRRHLNNSILKRIELQEGERIIELVFQTKIGEKKLISELHGKGNFILTDSKNKIINSAVIIETPKKIVKKGRTYKYIRAKFDIRKVTLHDFTEASKNWSGTSLINFLSSGLKLGKIYAGEICNQTKFDSSKDVDLLSRSEIKTLHSELTALLRKFDLGTSILTEKNAFPFELVGYSGKQFDSFNEALDNLYSKELEKKAQEKHKLTHGRAAVKLGKNIEKQESSRSVKNSLSPGDSPGLQSPHLLIFHRMSPRLSLSRQEFQASQQQMPRTSGSFRWNPQIKMSSLGPCSPKTESTINGINEKLLCLVATNWVWRHCSKSRPTSIGAGSVVEDSGTTAMYAWS